MRFGVFALAGLLALPATAAAQDTGGFDVDPRPELVPFTRVAVTPWVGFRVPYGSADYFVVTEQGEQFRLDEERGGGVALGLDAAYQLRGPLNLVAGFSYSEADTDVLNVRDLQGNQISFQSHGPEVWFLKAGVQYRLPDPVPDNRRFHPAAYITVAPALVWVDWPDFEGADEEVADDVSGTSRQFALNLGVDAVTRLGSRGLALTFSVEDYLTFWDTERTRVRDELLLGSLFEEPVEVEYSASSNNILILRAGLSWRF